MVRAKLTPRFTASARVDEISRGQYRLTIPAGNADSYRLAQLDDYSTLPRKNFPHHSLTLNLSARTSSDSIAGTWGFGLWNDPFGMSLGLGGNPFRLPALPNAIWFFGASEENYLSFRAERNEAETKRASQTKSQFESSPSTTSRASSTNGAPTAPSSALREVANGFIAQTFRSPKFHPLLIVAGLALPFSRKVTRRLLSRVITEDGIRLWNQGVRSRNATSNLVDSKSVDPSQWHRYRLEWSRNRALFEVDEVRVFESAVSPNSPLGVVIWIDNQYAAFTPEGKIGFGVLANPEPAWLEVKDLEIG